MRSHQILAGLIPLIACTPAHAQTAATPDKAADGSATRQKPPADIVVTAVARGRDRLDSAISTSSLRENDILTHISQVRR
ncbi:hypothetical protein CA237_16880 [Sphingomonas sp. ABOLH]|nr:hypothetical protein CA237_16880 [Sphingomonas sp. ABOLH]